VPVLGSLASVADPEAEHITRPIDGDTDDGVDGPVGDLAVADLDVDHVDEHDWVDAVQRPVLPGGHLFEHPVGDPRDRVPRDLCAIDVGEVRGDLARRQPLRRERDHQLFDACQPALPLLHDLRLERAVPVPGHGDVHLADLGQHRLRPGPVA
jgi:hypothetical protein